MFRERSSPFSLNLGFFMFPSFDGCHLPSCRGFSSFMQVIHHHYGGHLLFNGGSSPIVSFPSSLFIPLKPLLMLDSYMLLPPSSIKLLLLFTINHQPFATLKSPPPTNGL